MSYQCVVPGCPGSHVSKHEVCAVASNDVVLRGDKKCPHGYTSRSKCTVCDHEDDLAEKDAEIERLATESERRRAALTTALSCLQAALGPGFEVKPLQHDETAERRCTCAWDAAGCVEHN